MRIVIALLENNAHDLIVTPNIYIYISLYGSRRIDGVRAKVSFTCSQRIRTSKASEHPRLIQIANKYDLQKKKKNLLFVQKANFITTETGTKLHRNEGRS